ncbi:MAG: flagellar basal body L-ring protein [Pseudomonadota bacterium]|jgi:flagellar L-ring protein precursor FlgH
MMTRKLRFIVLMPLLLAACSAPLPKREPSFSPVAPADLRPPAQSSGSIYMAGYDNRLFEDHTARRVGDILTVNLLERTNSIKRAQNRDSKSDTISASLPTLFGLGALLLGGDMKTSMLSEKEFEGQGDVLQNNQLTGLISVTVVELLPNGNLKIRGEKRVTLNQGDEFIRLSGIVRPVDIKPSNIIDSEKIADATFMYTGEGSLNDANTHGWLSRVFNSPWFPL